MNWLNNFNSTNGKIIAGITMAHIVIITVCVMEARGLHFDPILLLELLAFIAAWAEISYRQFAKKRDTFKPALPADDDGPAPPAAAVMPRTSPSQPPPGTDPDIVRALESVAGVKPEAGRVPLPTSRDD